MDPLSAVSAGISALTSVFNAVGGIAGAVDSFAGLCSKFFDALSGMINVPEQQQAQRTVSDETQGWPTSQQQYAMAPVTSTFGGVRT